IRDIFIVGCMTGQRYSDYSRLSKDNIVGDNIHVLQKKTKSKAVVPLTDYVKEIFAKYNGCLPVARCIQYFNKAIKEICKKIGLTEPVVYEEEQAGEVVMVKKKKYEMISSHTARRTFATNMIRNNVSTSKIRKCTGHKSTACFDRYDRMTLTDNARSLAGNGYLS
ncbi:tyrosine-type recombinase/integrase, partial [Coprobacter fastidiosus]